MAKSGKGKKAGKKTTSARQHPDGQLILSLYRERRDAKEQVAEINSALTTSMQEAADAGVNKFAFPKAAAFMTLAEKDPIKAAVAIEDFEHCLNKMGFYKLVAPSMFRPLEVRSGKKTNGAGRKQLALSPPLRELVNADAD